MITDMSLFYWIVAFIVSIIGTFIFGKIEMNPIFSVGLGMVVGAAWIVSVPLVIVGIIIYGIAIIIDFICNVIFW